MSVFRIFRNFYFLNERNSNAVFLTSCLIVENFAVDTDYLLRLVKNSLNGISRSISR